MSRSYKQFKNLMKVEEIRGQRILTSFLPPSDNSRVEVFVKSLPQNLNEDVIVPFFEKIGAVHTLRLMLDKNNISNRGFAYLTYLRSEDATLAIKVLNGEEIIRNCPIQVSQSLNNCRIFLGGIPVKKTKDEVWQELVKKGITNIVDVIMYRSYNNRAENRGFVFIEFPTHQFAAKMRNRMKNMRLWNYDIIVDWSVPEPVVSQEEMMKVKILYVRNLNVMESRESLKATAEMYVNPAVILKVYKFKNYAFIHLTTREAAVLLLKSLKEHFKNTVVEVEFAKPSSEFTKPDYRKQMLARASPLSEMGLRNLQQNMLSPVDPFHSHQFMKKFENNVNSKEDIWPTYPCSLVRSSQVW